MTENRDTFGMPLEAAIAIDLTVNNVFTLVDVSRLPGARAFSMWGGPAVSVTLGSVAIIDASILSWRREDGDAEYHHLLRRDASEVVLPEQVF